MNFLPRAAFVLRWILSSHVTLEDVQADVPTGGIARGPAKLVERVEEREHTSAFIRLQLEPEKLRRAR
jgi:hypothetical protein